MMATNDLTLVEDAISNWANDEDSRRNGRRLSARMYFMRLQLAHLFEAVTLVKRVEKKFMAQLDECDDRTKGAFDELRKLSKSSDYAKLLEDMRNKMTFHYDISEIRAALDTICDKNPALEANVSFGTEPLHWHFELADLVADKIVVRRFWDIPEDADVRAAADEIAVRLQNYTKAFVEFAGGFIDRHTK